MSNNDKIYNYLRGIGLTGSISDMLYNWYLSKGVVGERDYYLTQTSILSKELNDLRYRYLVDRGYSGAYQDMLSQSLSSGTYFSDSPVSLFTSGQQGAWYDINDLSTLFQDDAGTVPVTAMEQSVGRILDISGNNNHAFQATTTKRGVVSRRVNLLTKTEQFDDANWLKSGGGDVATVTANTDIAPDGTLTADSFVPTVSGAYIVQNLPGQSVIPGMKLVAGVYTKSATRIIVFGGATPAGTDVYSIEPVAGWGYLQKVVRTVTVTTTGTFQHILTGMYAGAGSYVIWGASLTLATDAHLPYQRVNTATDYDADQTKFPAYLKFDGVDDALATGNIDFTGTDKMTVWAGVTKLSDAAFADIVNTGIISAVPGFYLGNSAGGQNFASRVMGSVLGATTTASGYTAPNTSILTGIFDISGSKSNLRVNGALTTNSSSLGTGNFSNSPMYIGADNGTSSYFNGRLYGLIVAGASYTQAQIESVEYYTKRKMKLP